MGSDRFHPLQVGLSNLRSQVTVAMTAPGEERLACGPSLLSVLCQVSSSEYSFATLGTVATKQNIVERGDELKPFQLTPVTLAAQRSMPPSFPTCPLRSRTADTDTAGLG